MKSAGLHLSRQVARTVWGDRFVKRGSGSRKETEFAHEMGLIAIAAIDRHSGPVHMAASRDTIDDRLESQDARLRFGR